jgi:hypothetical protein
VDLSRGVRSHRWPVQAIIEAGFGLATLCYHDIQPDTQEPVIEGILRLTDDAPAKDEWGHISAWAFGLQRALDVLEREPRIHTGRMALIGHSRNGKAALWAGAQDSRAALTIGNNSGCGGAALSRRNFGENVARINGMFPHWFCANFKKYNNKEKKLPIDQHQLLALFAPRKLYVASAEADSHADPKGEHLAVFHASPVFELYGNTPFPDPRQQQAINWQPQTTPALAYHIRAGKHDITPADWALYLAYARKAFGLE